MGSPCDGNGYVSLCSRPLGTPGHHDRRSPPGSPAGLLISIDEDRPRGVAPPPSSGFAFVKSTSSVGPSAQCVRCLSGTSAPQRERAGLERPALSYCVAVIGLREG